MGKRKNQQAPIWIPTTELPVSPGHPFYVRLNAILDEAVSTGLPRSSVRRSTRR